MAIADLKSVLKIFGGAVRIGAVHYNTMGEIDTVLQALESILH